MSRTLAVLTLALAMGLQVMAPTSPLAQGDPTAGIVLPSGWEVIEFHRHERASSPRACCIVGMARGRGGLFGSDLFFTDAGSAWPGMGIFRAADADGDGDALDPGESTKIHDSSSSGPQGLGLVFGHDVGNGFDNDAFMADDRLNRIWRLSDNTGSLQVAQTFSGGMVSPGNVAFTPDGDLLLVMDAFNFGGFSADARIHAFTPSGARSNWADGGNTPRGLWDINDAVAMSSDGWLTVLNKGITRSFDRELLEFRDLNGDGDANDPGEARFLANANRIGEQIGLDYDADDVLWIGRGREIWTLEDVNGDGDFWDASTGDFDAGEQAVWATGFPHKIWNLRVEPNGELLVAMGDPNDPYAFILRIRRTQTNRPPVAVDDFVSVARDSSIAIDVLVNDMDPDGDPLTILSVTEPTAGGTAVANGDGTITYTPLSLAVLIDRVKELPGLDKGIINSLVKKLENAAKSRARGNGRAARNQIRAFMNELRALVRSGRLSSDLAEPLLDLAERLLDPADTDAFEYTIGDGRGGTDSATVTVSIS